MHEKSKVSSCSQCFSAAPAAGSPVSQLWCVAGSLGVAAYDLDLVGLDHGLAVVHLEGDVLDQESPHFVAESVRIEASLQAVEQRVSR